MYSTTTPGLLAQCSSGERGRRPRGVADNRLRRKAPTFCDWATPRGFTLRERQRASGLQLQGQQCKQKVQRLAATAALQQAASHPDGTSVGNGVSSLLRIANAFYQFTRPHTMLGTFVSVVSVSLLALGSQPLTRAAVSAITTALVPALLMNICIVGLNQLFDVDIDKVNKPYLPLASGDFSMQTGIAIVLITGAVAIGLGIASNSQPLLATLVLSLALGVAYSTDLPFLRWKRYPAIAAMCILTVRSILVQLGFYFHMKLSMGVPVVTLTRPLIFAMSFMLAFSIVIALFKDIPDVEGDSQAGVRTFSVRAGVGPIFWTCIAVLELAYAGAIGVGLASPVLWSRYVTVAAHAIMGLLLLLRAKTVDLAQPKSIAACYMFVWKLFYTEYLLIPLLR